MIKKRINGQQMAQNVGEQIILLGCINKVSRNGSSIELKTSDNMLINVALPEPVDGNLEGYIEVHGTVNSKTTMACSNYICFPPEMTTQFNVEQYNELMILMNTLGDNKWKMSETNTVF